MAITRPLRRGDVCLIRLDPARGSEIRKTRPCLVVSPDELNQHLHTLIVAPMTTSGQAYRGVSLPESNRICRHRSASHSGHGKDCEETRSHRLEHVIFCVECFARDVLGLRRSMRMHKYMAVKMSRWTPAARSTEPFRISEPDLLGLRRRRRQPDSAVLRGQTVSGHRER